MVFILLYCMNTIIVRSILLLFTVY